MQLNNISYRNLIQGVHLEHVCDENMNAQCSVLMVFHKKWYCIANAVSWHINCICNKEVVTQPRLIVEKVNSTKGWR